MSIGTMEQRRSTREILEKRTGSNYSESADSKTHGSRSPESGSRMNMHRILTMIVVFGLLVPVAVTSPPQSFAQPWKLSWSDEFNGPDGAPPDPTKWEIVTGGNGFGNKELEQYTARSENVRQEHGNLV